MHREKAASTLIKVKIEQMLTRKQRKRESSAVSSLVIVLTVITTLIAGSVVSGQLLFAFTNAGEGETRPLNGLEGRDIINTTSNGDGVVFEQNLMSEMKIVDKAAAKREFFQSGTKAYEIESTPKNDRSPKKPDVLKREAKNSNELPWQNRISTTSKETSENGRSLLAESPDPVDFVGEPNTRILAQAGEDEDESEAQQEVVQQTNVPQGTIASIDIRGNRRIEDQLILANVSSKVGESLSTETVREDVKMIYKLGFFENVSAEVEASPEGLVLVYQVKEKPVVVDLRVRGNDEIKDENILEVIEVEEGRIIDLRKVDTSREAIAKLYSQKGFVGTEVNFTLEPEGEGTVSVGFDIDEGEKAYIREVELIGNKALEDEEIEDAIFSRPKGFFSFLTGKGLYNPQEIERDTERIRSVYLDKGYLDVSVSKPETSFSEEKEGYVVSFRIEEGERYKVGTIDFAGDLIVPEEELNEVIELEEDEYFSSGKLTSDISELTTFYGDKGYAFANVDPGFRQDRENLIVDVTFNLEKGNQVSIRKIDIMGNTRTRDKVIRREIPIEERELFSSSKIKKIKPRVSRLGYFKDNVEVTTERVPQSEDELDVNVKVEEKPTGFFSVAGGFSSVETFIFAGQIQESNLFGYGKSLSLSAQIGGVTQLFLLNYQDPYLLDTNFTLDFLAFRSNRRFRDFDRESLGGSISIGRRLFSNLSGNVTYRYEDVEVDDISNDARLILTQSSRTISSVAFGLRWDTRNNLLNPTRGNLSRTNIEFAGIPFGGDTEFIRYTASSRQWFPLPYDTVLALQGRYGIIDFRDAGNDLIVEERFFLGGPNSLRGFDFRRVGPRVDTPDGDFVIIGGVQELLGSADYIIPLLPEAGLNGVLFFDIGNVFNDGEDLSFDPSDLRKDAGFGFRWLSPLGPLRLEIGFPFGDRLPGEDSYEIQFTVGSLF